MLLMFICGLISTLASFASQSLPLQWLKENFPSSLYLLRKVSGVHSNKMKEYVLCPKCHSKLEECFLRTSTGLIESKKGHYVAYPDHPHATRRIVQCNTTLLKQVKHGATYKYVPKKVYLYNGVISSLKALIDCDYILQLCNHWRNRTHIEDTLADVTDGQVCSSLWMVWNFSHQELDHSIFQLNNSSITPFSRIVCRCDILTRTS